MPVERDRFGQVVRVSILTRVIVLIFDAVAVILSVRFQVAIAKHIALIRHHLVPLVSKEVVTTLLGEVDNILRVGHDGGIACC